MTVGVPSKPVKPGVQTTEFWVTIFGNLIGIAQLTGLWEYLPSGQNKWVIIALAFSNGLYKVSRGLAKAG